MKKHKTIQFIVAALFIASACTDDRDNLMVNDQIGLLHSTYTETEIFRGMDTPYQLFVIKSGKGKQETEVSISVDETVLQSYNTDNGTSIQLLPSDCYTILQPALRLNDSDYRKAFDMECRPSIRSSFYGKGIWLAHTNECGAKFYLCR